MTYVKSRIKFNTFNTFNNVSWNQVCKAISGIGGYVSISETEKVRPLELMQSLGVHVSKNSYKPKDIFGAWSERMKKDGKVLMAHDVPDLCLQK